MKKFIRVVKVNLPALVITFGTFTISLTVFYRLFSQIPPSPPHRLVSLPVSRELATPSVSAKYIFIEDLTSHEVLYAQRADEPVAPASTTKMMTALVAIQAYPLDDIVTVTRSFSEGTNIGLQPGEKMTVEQLIFAMLVQSANDAAENLADHMAGGRTAFITAMNTQTAAMNLTHTRFVNPTGLDEDGHFSSATDLTRIADALMKNPKLARIASAENVALIERQNHTGRLLTNSNSLLGKIPGGLGVKTGFTDNAGQALVTLIDRGGHPLMIAILGSTDRSADTEKLINWIYQNFSWEY
jgi:D-alanyl-D-alanine carboxypeptidase